MALRIKGAWRPTVHAAVVDSSATLAAHGRVFSLERLESSAMAPLFPFPQGGRKFAVRETTKGLATKTNAWASDRFDKAFAKRLGGAGPDTDRSTATTAAPIVHPDLPPQRRARDPDVIGAALRPWAPKRARRFGQGPRQPAEAP